MKNEEVLKLLTALERRLTTVADQARETCEQARHTLERVELLRRELEKFKTDLSSTADTAEHKAFKKTQPEPKEPKEA
jgi:hypothetical protein